MSAEFDTTKLKEIVACLRKGADVAQAKAEQHWTHNEKEDGAKQLKRAERYREWAVYLELVELLLKRKRGPQKPKETHPETEAFLAFWKAYPKKKSRGDAWKAWCQMSCEVLASDILSSISRLKSTAEWLKENGAFIPYPATWLRAKGWHDEVNTPPASKVGSPHGRQEDPAGWRAWLTANRLIYTEFRFAQPYLKTDFRKWQKDQREA